MSITNIASQVFKSVDIVNELGPDGINRLIEWMWLAYRDVNDQCAVTSAYNENSITKKWAEFLTRRWGMDNTSIKVKVIPLHQVEDENKKKGTGLCPTIDFCFIGWNMNDSYFGAECKLLKANDPKRYNLYVTEGVYRFLDGRYSSKSTESAMVAYVVDENIVDTTGEIDQRINGTNPLKSFSRDYSWDEPHYKSTHSRNNLSPIVLHHLFFDFN